MREAFASSPSVKRPNLPAFPIISDSDSVPRSELGEDEDEEDRDHKISNTDTIIHLLLKEIWARGSWLCPTPSRTVACWWEPGSGDDGPASVSTACTYWLETQELCRRTNLPFLFYADVMETCFCHLDNPLLRRWAGKARRVVEVFLCITQLGFCCAFTFVFISQSMEQISTTGMGRWTTTHRPSSPSPYGSPWPGIRNQVPVPVSMTANLTQFSGLAIHFYYLCKTFHTVGERNFSHSWGQILI